MPASAIVRTGILSDLGYKRLTVRLRLVQVGAVLGR